jgi:hypothetical protein
MVKLRLNLPDGDGYFFGLAEAQLEALRAGKPLKIQLGALGGPNISVILQGGKSEGDILRDLQKHLGGQIRRVAG